MFDHLPETNRSRNPKKGRAFLAAFALQVFLVSGIIVLQMAMPEKLGEFQLLTTLHMAAPPPPPAPEPASTPRPPAVERKTTNVNPVATEKPYVPPALNMPPEMPTAPAISEE